MLARAHFLMFIVALLFTAPWCIANDDLKRLKKLIEAIRTRGEPITVEELNKQFALKKGVDDTSKLLLEGIALLEGKEYLAHKKDLPILGILHQEPYPKPGEKSPILEQAEKFVNSQAEVLAKFHEAAKRGGRAFFPLQPTGERDELGYSFKEFWRIPLASDLLQFDIEVKLRRGDVRGAAKSIASLLSLAISFESMAGLFSFPTENFGFVQAYYLVQNVGRFPFTDEELIDFQNRIRAISPKARLAYLQQFGRVSFLRQYAPMGDLRTLELQLKSDEKTYGTIVEEFADYLEFREKVGLAAKKEFPDVLRESNEALQAFSAKWKERKGGYPLHPFVELEFGSIDMAAVETLLIQASDAGIACERYRRENKKLPTSLEALVPKFLPIVPTDPFSGKPMLFKVADNGITIYSVGRDNEDDGGSIEDFQDGDFGLRFLTK